MNILPNPLERAIDIVGGPSAMARILDLPWPSTVTNWVARGVPPERCRQIEEATKGAVTRYELNPDVFGPAPERNEEAA